MKLYELNEAYQNILNLDLEEEDLQTALNSLEGTLKEKSENIGKLLNSLDLEASMYDAEIKRLQAKKTSASKKHSNIKEYLSESLKSMHVDKLECDLFKFSFRKSESVVITDVHRIPEQYMNTEEVKTPDKKELKKAIKEAEKTGFGIDGCCLETKHSLQIK